MEVGYFSQFQNLTLINFYIFSALILLEIYFLDLISMFNQFIFSQLQINDKNVEHIPAMYVAPLGL